jgi:hypothetical protein
MGLLGVLHSEITEPIPWLCAGDINEVLFHHEKEGASQELKLAWTDSRASWKV